MLSRLAVGQKLGLLLTVPLTAVLVILVPFSVDRIDEARAAGATVDAARAARDVGRLVQELQQERLLTLGYLTLPAVDRAALVVQAQAVTDTAAELRGRLGPRSAELDRALAGLASLASVRQAVLDRRTGPEPAYEAYRDAARSLLDALRLTVPARIDARSRSQLDALDALLRANEEATSIGAAVMTAIADRRSGAPLVLEARAAQRLHSQRFRLLAGPAQVELLDAVEQGGAGRRIEALTVLFRTDAARAKVPVADAMTAAGSYVELLRILQDRIARDVASRAESRADAARATAFGVVVTALLLLALVVALSTAVYRSIAHPLRRLTRAATMVAELAGGELARVADVDEADAHPPKLAAVDIRSADEIGELATAFNRVQATAALLLERQVTTRRNVALMFANVAQRTRTLVSRQLAHIDDLERDEQDSALLDKLYRLDHLTNRLRRSASSLMVVSGHNDNPGTAQPTSLADVVRSALGEIEGFRAVRLGPLCEAVISADLIDDLRLMLAELFENATAFSPPGSPVEVFANLREDCHITIVDQGIGMSPDRLDEENQRLLGRERIDITPTSTLGLFVVGRLARRHGLQVRLSPTPGGGVTATVVVPAARLIRSTWAMPVPAMSTTPAMGGVPGPAALPAASGATALPGTPGATALNGMSAGAALPGATTLPGTPGATTLPGTPGATALNGMSAEAALPGATTLPDGTALTGGAALTGLPGASGGAAPTAVPDMTVDGGFTWFERGGSAPQAWATPAEPAAAERLRPAGHAVTPEAGHAVTPGAGPPPGVGRDPAAERAELDGFERGVARAAAHHRSPAHPPATWPPRESGEAPDGVAAPEERHATAPPTRPGHADAVPVDRSPTGAPVPDAPVRGGLTRRVPGAHLAESIREELSVRPSSGPAPAPTVRDPEAERAAFHGYAAGLERARRAVSVEAPEG